MALRLKRLEDLSPIPSAASEKGLYSTTKLVNGVSVSYELVSDSTVNILLNVIVIIN